MHSFIGSLTRLGVWLLKSTQGLLMRFERILSILLALLDLVLCTRTGQMGM